MLHDEKIETLIDRDSIDPTRFGGKNYERYRLHRFQDPYHPDLLSEPWNLYYKTSFDKKMRANIAARLAARCLRMLDMSASIYRINTLSSSRRNLNMKCVPSLVVGCTDIHSTIISSNSTTTLHSTPIASKCHQQTLHHQAQDAMPVTRQNENIRLEK